MEGNHSAEDIHKTVVVIVPNNGLQMLMMFPKDETESSHWLVNEKHQSNLYFTQPSEINITHFIKKIECIKKTRNLIRND